MALLRAVGVDDAVHRVVDHAQEAVVHVHAQEHLAALAVDDLPLLVHHVVVAKHVLASVEVGHLHPLLGALDLLGDEAVLDGDLVAGVQPGEIMPFPQRGWA